MHRQVFDVGTYGPQPQSVLYRCVSPNQFHHFALFHFAHIAWLEEVKAKPPITITAELMQPPPPAESPQVPPVEPQPITKPEHIGTLERHVS